MSLKDRLLESSLNLETFNPYENPPNIEKAQQHGKATKLGFNQDGETDQILKQCPCCGNTINKREIPLNCADEDLLFMGVGYPLYFKLFKYFGAIILIVFVVSGSGFYLLRTIDCESNCVYFLQVPILDLDQRRKTSLLFDVIHFVTSMLILILTFFIKIRIEKDIYNLEATSISAEQYTIIVQNLPQDVQEDQIIQWSKQKFGTKPLNVNFAYNLSQLQDAFEQRSFLTIRLNRMVIKKRQLQKQREENQKNLLTEYIKELEEKIYKYDVIIEHYRHENINCRKNGTVFLTYLEQKTCREILDRYETSFFSTIMNNTLSSFRNRSVQFNKVPVVIRKAPAPREIIWENLAFSYIRYVITQLLALITMIFVLFVAFKIQLRFAELEYEYRVDDKDEDLDDIIINFIESFSLSVMIMLVNLLLRFIIKTFINIKKHYSYSRYQSSFCFYYSLMYVFNTCFMIYIIHMRHRPSNQLTEKQLPTSQRDRILLYDIHILMLINALSDPIYKIIDPFMWIRILRRRYIASLPAESNPYTQAYVNQLWEEYSISNVDNYQYIFRVLVVTVWFAHAAPFGVLISLVGFFVDYWITKYIMLRWSKKPETISKRIAVPMIKSLPLVPLVYLCGVLQYVYKVSDSNNLFGFIFNFLGYAAVILITIFVIGAYYYLKPPPKYDPDPTRYDDVQITFDESYDSENPMNKIKTDIKYAAYRDLKKLTLKTNPKIFADFLTLNKKQSVPSDRQSQIIMLKKKKLRKLQTINIEMQEKGTRVKNQGSYREKSSSDSSVED